MKLFFSVLSVAMLVVVWMAFQQNGEVIRLYGIADAKETVINSAYAVEIKHIYVVTGQAVKNSDTLVIVSSPELERKLSDAEHALSEVKIRLSTQNTQSRSEIKRLRATQDEKISAIKAELAELEAQYAINKKLMSELHNLKNSDKQIGDDSISPMRVRIEGLKKELALVSSPAQIQIDQINQSLASDEPLSEQVKRLQSELQVYIAEKSRLVILANEDGVVGTVHFKDGEKVLPFAPILTFHTTAPSYVQGFIHENVYGKVDKGQKVIVKSIAKNNYSMEGEVVGIGSRIVEYPVRLRVRPDVQVWGREILILLPKDNGFLLGEKVLITPKTDVKIVLSSGIVPVVKKKRMIDRKEYRTQIPLHEASGIAWDDTLKQWLLVSDDTPDKQPIIYSFNEHHQTVTSHTIQGIDKVNDMEAISRGSGQDFYILTSQSMNAKGNLPAERKLLIKIENQKNRYVCIGKIVLRDVLQTAALSHQESEWAKFITLANQNGSFEIEGMTYLNHDLYLGFKAPLSGDLAVILKISDVEAAFVNQTVLANQISLWKSISLLDSVSGVYCRISDLYSTSTHMYITGVGNNENQNGGLWKLDLQSSTLNQLKSYVHEQPEGIALDRTQNRAIVLFDKGKKNKSEYEWVDVN